MTDITLDYLAAARVSGEDAESFLQAQLSADLAPLSTGDAGFSAYCEPKGKVIAVICVIRRSDSYILIVARSLLDTLIAELGKYVLRASVSIEALEDAVRATVSGETMAYALAPAAAEGGEALNRAQGDCHAAELRRGVIWLDPQTSKRFLPQMLGLERLGAVSFRKGCYPGQEVIARVRYLGKVKQSPLVVVTAKPFEASPGTEVELLGDEGPEGSAVVVDCAPEAGGSVVFMVARKPEGAEVRWLRSGDARAEVRENL